VALASSQPPITDICDPNRILPKIDAVDPSLPQERRDNVEPSDWKSNVDNELPNLAVDRSDKFEPKFWC
jgi:hypothetical protein